MSMIPHAYRKWLEGMINFSGSKKTPERFVVKSLVFSLIAGILASIFFREYFIWIFSIVTFSVFALMNGFLILAVEKRTGFVEKILPDALQLMAANSRAGHIPSRSLLLSARKEFGPLSDAIKNAGKEMMTGQPLNKSLAVITKSIKSNLLEKTMELIVEGIRSGGQFASLLEENANDLRRSEAIRKEVKANIMMYIIFIGFAGCMGAPMLYSLSSFLISTISSLSDVASLPEDFSSQVSIISFSTVDVSQEFLFLFNIVAIIITTFFGGLIIGLISTGSEKAGIKYVPILIAVALAIFFISKILITAMFGSMIPSM